MRTTEWSDDHEQMLAATDPVVAAPSQEEVERVWRHVAARIQDPPKRRGRGRIVVAGLLATGVLGGAAVATADQFSARTGRGPVDAEDLRLGGPGESLDPAAPDYADVLHEESADIPFPSEYYRTVAIEHHVHDERGSEAGEGSVSTGAVRAWMADQAVCAWANEWAVAIRSGNDAGRQEAAQAIRTAPTWQAVIDIDPEPYSRMRSGTMETRDGATRTFRYRDESQFFYLAELGDAVGGQEIGSVAEILADSNGYCRGELVADIPRADAMFGDGAR